jgi:uncharacterized phage protein (TIGR02218 family)
MGLISRYSRQCTVELYSVQCGVIKGTYESSGVLDSVAANVLTSTTFGGESDGYWKGGYISINSKRAKIIEHVSNDVTILPLIYGLAAGNTFEIYPGCDHLSTTCSAKFSNLKNYKGQPNIPLKTIWESEAMF